MIAEDDIDQLYKLPLAEFTAARDALAKRAGPRSAEIKKLEKPNAAAWGVNQLFWHRPKTLERLIAAFEKVRTAQANLLAGRPAELAAAEQGHTNALDKAAAEVRELLQAADDAASATTMAAVGETLRALPFSPTNGRLVRPLQPVGFGALAGLMGSVPRPVRKAEVVAFDKGRRPAKTSAREEEAARRAAEAQREEIARAEAELRDARKVETSAETAAERAKDALEKSRRTIERLRRELDEAEESAREQQDQATTTAAEARAAKSARQKLEDRLDAIRGNS